MHQRKTFRNLILILAAGATLTRAAADSSNLIVNANFERVYAAQRLTATNLPYVADYHRQLPAYAGEPFLPNGWMAIPNRDGAGRLATATEDGWPALRVRTQQGEEILLRQARAEVVPETVCAMSVEIKGAGRVTISGTAAVPGPYLKLGSTTGTAGDTWQRISFTAPVGFHRHLATLDIRVHEGADLLLRGVELSTTPAVRAAGEGRVTARQPRDADTLFYEDFDGAACAFAEDADVRRTDEHGGRFGRGLRVNPAGGGARAPLTFGDLPPQGTIEFWFKPDALPRDPWPTCLLALRTQLPGRQNTQAEFSLDHRFGHVTFGFRRERWKVDITQPNGWDPGWGWWQPGTWHHFAGAWDAEAMRVYVDGVLSGLCYGTNHEGRAMERPHGRALELVLPAAGVIDDIRISRALPFSPVVPPGLTNPPLVAPSAPAAATATAPLTTPAQELDALRRANLAPLPDPRADYVFDAALAQPAWEGMQGLQLLPGYFGAGADGVALDCQREARDGFYRPSAARWTLDGIAPGRYWIGLWLESQDATLPSEYSMTRLLTCAYLNGWPVRFATTTEPVQVRPGVWLAELQAAEAAELKPGDEIAVRHMHASNVFWRVVLYRTPPARGHGITGQTFGCMGQDIFPRLRLSIQADIVGSGEAGTPHEARIRLANPLPYTAEALVDWTLADYFGAPVTSRTERVVLEAHKTYDLNHVFIAAADARAYQLDVRTRPAPGFRSPIARPVELIELNDWTKLEFLPNLSGPLEAWQHTRFELRTDNVGGRMSLTLDGADWEAAPLASRRIPASPPSDLIYAPCRVPYISFTPMPRGVFGMWFRKKFRVPAWLQGERFAIEVDSAVHERTVFLNGQRLGTDTFCGDGFDVSIPLRVDAGEALRPDAENELVVLVRGPVALMAEDYVDRYDPENAWLEAVMRHLDRPALARNAVNLGPVRLRTEPAVRVRQTLVLPDVPAGALHVLSRIENTRATPCTVELRYDVFQEGRPVPVVIPPQAVTVPPGATVEVRANGSGRELQMYTPARPVLARLATTLAENGVPIDVEETRFGYRSLTVKGPRLELNGQPIFLFGSGPLNRMQECLERENGMKISRTTSSGIGLPFLDEIGRLIYPAIGSGDVLTWDTLNNDHLWEQARAKAVESIWIHGSKPSCIGWDLGNENYFYSVYQVGLEGQARGGERMAGLAEAIRARLWPGFWLMSDGDCSLGGRLNFTSWHYLNQGWSQGYSASPRGFRDTRAGVSHYPPDCFFLDGAAYPPRPDTVVHGSSPEADDWTSGMACADTEDFWFVSRNNGPGIAKYIGDRAAISPAWQFYTGRGMWWGRLSVQGYRDMPQTAVLGLYPINFLNTVVQDVTFAVPQQEVRYYGGARFVKRLTLHDDDFAPGVLEFAWRLLAPDGRVVRQGGSGPRQTTTSYLQRDQIAFEIPEVAERTRFVLDMTLHKDGRLREHEQRLVDVWPAGGRTAPPDRAPEGLALFDPSGVVAPILARLGVQAAPVSALTAEALSGARVLIVGPDCAAVPPTPQALRDFAAAGGRVFVLPQQESTWLPVDTYLEKRRHASMGFVRAPSHPVMRGLQDVDFAMWNPGHLIARGLYRTPNRGNFLPLVDGGHETLAWTPLLEIYLGRGAILATQLPLIDGFDHEPMAAELWRRILYYLAGSVYRRPAARLAVLTGVSAPVQNRLAELRAEFDVVPAPDAAWPVTLVEMNRASFDEQLAAFRAYVQGGGTLVLHRVRPEHAGWLSALLGRSARVEVQPYRSWVDRQALERRDGLAEGLNNLDFYWRPNVAGEGWESLCQVSTAPAEPRGQVEYVVRVADVADYLFPGGWLEVPVGQGRVVIDQLKWELPEKDKIDYGSPMRVASLLLSNLGVVQRLPAPRPSLPPRVAYAPIDLTAVVDRGLRDETSGDGVGWVDWGPGQDLSDFPTGEVVFDGIPFQVPSGDQNAVVLRTSPDFVKSLAGYPDRVTIPVNRSNVAGLYFLHTGGWTGGRSVYGWREIRYADGTQEVLPLNETSCADWNYGHDDFPDEEGTATTVAWKGACKQYPVTRVYKTLWVNPHPEKKIVEVVLSNRGLPQAQWRFLAHLGVTAALHTGAPAAVPVARRDPPRSQELLQEALALQTASNIDAAIAKLEAALAADDQNVGAWMALTGLRAETATVEEFSALCARWSQAMPANYQAHNVLGRFLEQKRQYAAALAEYRKSLEIEWNQPPTIEARKRMEQALRPAP